MNATLDNFFRDLTCAAAAVAVTLIVSLSFVESTAVAPGAHAAAGTSIPHVALHA